MQCVCIWLKVEIALDLWAVHEAVNKHPNEINLK